MNVISESNNVRRLGTTYDLHVFTLVVCLSSSNLGFSYAVLFIFLKGNPGPALKWW